METRFEKTILRNLITNEEFSRKVLPYLKPEYFREPSDLVLFEEVNKFTSKYNKLPTLESMSIEVSSRQNVNEDVYEIVKETLQEIKDHSEKDNLDWLVENTEAFCRDRAIYGAILTSMDIIGKSKKTKLSEGAIPELMTQALSITFNPNVGHDYIEDAEDRFAYYHRKEEKLEFDLAFFNRITKNGISKKTLNVILAGTGVGKSLALCHFSAGWLNQGKNVLYITLELAEQEVAKRIDANLLNMSFDDLMDLPKDLYLKKIDSLKQKHVGKLVVVEYPTASASVNHFRALLSDLKLKKKFIPDVIVVDYLNICISSRLNLGANINSYMYVKAIAEELRGLAVEYNLPIFTATQTNRTGFTSSDVGLEDTSESFGLPATADFMFAMINSEELAKLGHIQIKQLKNRYRDNNIDVKFNLGIDRPRMKLYDLEDSAQEEISDSKQVQPTKKDKFKSLKVNKDVPF